MEFAVLFLNLIAACSLVAFSPHFVQSHPSLLGVHPLDEGYYASEVIKCKDGSKSISTDRINDDFCDCADGTDEPGTSACPNGKFYCRNVGSTPQFLFSSRVNDHICDCCDGSDENDGSFHCPGTCIMGGNIVYKANNYVSGSRNKISFNENTVRSKTKLEDLIGKLTGLKILILLQFVLIIFWMGFCVCHRRIKSRRRRYQRVNPD